MRSIVAALGIASCLSAQGTLEDYKRAQVLTTTARGLVINLPGPANWIGGSDHLWYSRSAKGGTQFVLVDAASGTKKPAFDHERLAAGINAASTGSKYTALTLPFARPTGRAGPPRAASTAGPLTFLDNEQS